jgi:hypothetical protein
LLKSRFHAYSTQLASNKSLSKRADLHPPAAAKRKGVSVGWPFLQTVIPTPRIDILTIIFEDLHIGFFNETRGEFFPSRLGRKMPDEKV